MILSVLPAKIEETKVVLEKHARRARVLIADDHQLIMAELVSLLREQVDVVGTVSDGRSLVEAAVRHFVPGGAPIALEDPCVLRRS